MLKVEQILPEVEKVWWVITLHNAFIHIFLNVNRCFCFVLLLKKGVTGQAVWGLFYLILGLHPAITWDPGEERIDDSFLESSSVCLAKGDFWKDFSRERQGQKRAWAQQDLNGCREEQEADTRPRVCVPEGVEESFSMDVPGLIRPDPENGWVDELKASQKERTCTARPWQEGKKLLYRPFNLSSGQCLTLIVKNLFLLPTLNLPFF